MQHDYNAANNQLFDSRFAGLHEKVFYMRLILVNSGGMIAATVEYETQRNPKKRANYENNANDPRILTGDY